MTAFFNANNIRIFDYPRFVMSPQDEPRINTEKIAEEHGLPIDSILKTKFCKEERILLHR